MGIFGHASVVCVRRKGKGKGKFGKYLLAADDKVSLILQKNGRTSRRAWWTVESVSNSGSVILKSFYDKYLSASNNSCMFGGFRVLQTSTPDESIEWEPIAEGTQLSPVKLRTANDTVLRACKWRHLGIWSKTVVHGDYREPNEILWEIEILKIRIPEKLHQDASTFYNEVVAQNIREDVVRFFQLIDKDKNDELSIDEFLRFFRPQNIIFNQYHNNMTLEDFFAAFDRDGDGRLQFNEFITLHYFMFMEGQAIGIKEYVESIRAQSQSDAQNGSETRPNAAYLDLIKLVVQGLGSAATLCGCCIM